MRQQISGQMSLFDIMEPQPEQMPMKDYLTRKGFKNEYFERPDHECIVEVADIHEYPNIHYYEAKYVLSFGRLVQQYPQKCGYECHWWREIKPIECQFSGHSCNKAELWKIADTLDELMCPHVCCRKCNTKMCGARCNGSAELKEAAANHETVTMFGDEWHLLSEKPQEISKDVKLQVLGTYKYNNQEKWRCCPAYFDGNEIIAQDVPWDILRPEWKYWNIKKISVDIQGICDDAVCPTCGRDFLYPQENDLEACPYCKQRVDWKRWHDINDEEEA